MHEARMGEIILDLIFNIPRIKRLLPALWPHQLDYMEGCYRLERAGS